MLGTLRTALVAHIPAVLDAHGCDSAKALRQAGITRATLAKADGTIGYDAVGRLIDAGIRATGPHFGLLIGEHFSPEAALGDVVHLMTSAPTVGAALHAFIFHQHLNDSGAVPVLMTAGGSRAALAYSIYRHDVPAIDAFYDAALVYGMQIMRMLCGKSWRPQLVRIAHRRPPDAAPYKRAFGPNVSFDGDVSAIEFSATVLEKPVAGADPARFALLRDRMAQRLQDSGVSFSMQVRRALVPLLLSGTATGAKVAEFFSVSERVLRNRLAAERTTMRALVQGAKLEIAAQLLQSTQLTVSEIGSAVGYSDPPSFVRAFKSGFDGTTPAVWRMRNRQDG